MVSILKVLKNSYLYCESCLIRTLNNNARLPERIISLTTSNGTYLGPRENESARQSWLCNLPAGASNTRARMCTRTTLYHVATKKLRDFATT